MNDKYIVHFISKTRKKLIKFIELELAKNGLKEIDPSYGNILTVLFDSKSMLTMNEIAKKTSKDKSTISVLVNKLCKLGYIEKIKNPSDKRITFIKLTKKALDIEKTYTSISDSLNKTAFENFSDKEKETFLSLFKKMNTNLNNSIK